MAPLSIVCMLMPAVAKLSIADGVCSSPSWIIGDEDGQMPHLHKHSSTSCDAKCIMHFDEVYTPQCYMVWKTGSKSAASALAVTCRQYGPSNRFDANLTFVTAQLAN